MFTIENTENFFERVNPLILPLRNNETETNRALTSIVPRRSLALGSGGSPTGVRGFAHSVRH